MAEQLFLLGAASLQVLMLFAQQGRLIRQRPGLLTVTERLKRLRLPVDPVDRLLHARDVQAEYEVDPLVFGFIVPNAFRFRHVTPRATVRTAVPSVGSTIQRVPRQNSRHRGMRNVGTDTVDAVILA